MHRHGMAINWGHLTTSTQGFFEPSKITQETRGKANRFSLYCPSNPYHASIPSVICLDSVLVLSCNQVCSCPQLRMTNHAVHRFKFRNASSPSSLLFRYLQHASEYSRLPHLGACAHEKERYVQAHSRWKILGQVRTAHVLQHSRLDPKDSFWSSRRLIKRYVCWARGISRQATMQR